MEPQFYVPNLKFVVLAEIDKDSTPREAVGAGSLRLTSYVRLWPKADLLGLRDGVTSRIDLFEANA